MTTNLVNVQLNMQREHFTYESNQNGYMIYYKGKPLGGAGVKLPRDQPLHRQYVKANRQMFQQDAEREIDALVSGNGQARFRVLINLLR